MNETAKDRLASIELLACALPSRLGDKFEPASTTSIFINILMHEIADKDKEFQFSTFEFLTANSKNFVIEDLAVKERLMGGSELALFGMCLTANSSQGCCVIPLFSYHSANDMVIKHNLVSFKDETFLILDQSFPEMSLTQFIEVMC